MYNPTPNMTAPRFKDYFSAASADYAAFRPTYPALLFEFVASLPAKRETAWDCATGSGQAAVPLADHFQRVIATDASAEQLAHATRHPRVAYRVAMADASSIDDASVDLVTVAQALHWLPLDRFFAEVRRVIAPGGVLAVWCYTKAIVANDIDAVVDGYYSRTCADYWPPERALVDQAYAGIELPIDEVPSPPLVIEAPLALEAFTGYLRTWSATRKLAAATGRDPVAPVEEALRPLWGAPGEKQRVRWPIRLRAGRVIRDV